MSYLFVFWHIIFVDEENDVFFIWHYDTDSLNRSFVNALVHILRIWAPEEGRAFLSYYYDHIDYYIGLKVDQALDSWDYVGC